MKQKARPTWDDEAVERVAELTIAKMAGRFHEEFEKMFPHRSIGD
jgi:hypothetical protein